MPLNVCEYVAVTCPYPATSRDSNPQPADKSNSNPPPTDADSELEQQPDIEDKPIASTSTPTASTSPPSDTTVTSSRGDTTSRDRGQQVNQGQGSDRGGRNQQQDDERTVGRPSRTSAPPLTTGRNNQHSIRQGQQGQGRHRGHRTRSRSHHLTASFWTISGGVLVLYTYLRTLH